MIKINVSVGLDISEVARLFEMSQERAEILLPQLCKSISPSGEGMQVSDKGSHYSLGILLAISYALDEPGAKKYREWANTTLSGSLEDIEHLITKLSESPELSTQGIPQMTFGEAIKKLVNVSKPKK